MPVVVRTDDCRRERRGTIGFQQSGTVAAQKYFEELDRTSGVQGILQNRDSPSHARGASYGDLLIGNYMTEAIYPSILHQDPRYFRRGAGAGLSRFAYAISQVFWTHSDSGGTQFNYSEWLGNPTAVAISNAYYRDQRSAGNSISKLGTQVAVDAVGNVLKEFWPDLLHKFSKKSRNETANLKP